jgi:ABC-type sugar transport system substrate-binding protein
MSFAKKLFITITMICLWIAAASLTGCAGILGSGSQDKTSTAASVAIEILIAYEMALAGGEVDFVIINADDVANILAAAIESHSRFKGMHVAVEMIDGRESVRLFYQKDSE